MRTYHLLLVLALLPACRTTTAEAPATVTQTSGDDIAPTSLAELLQDYAAMTHMNLTYDEATAEWLADMSVSKLDGGEVYVIAPRAEEISEAEAEPGFEVIALQYAESDAVAVALEDLLADASGGANPGVKVLSQPRTNSLLMMGDPERLAQMKDLVVLLDVQVKDS
jgi:Bacterial type II/III secretion system short domain